MRIKNLTDIDVYQTFWNLVAHSKLNTKGMQVKVTWLRENSMKAYGGHYDPNNGSISVRINKEIKFPYPLQMGTGEWFENPDGSFFQILRKVMLKDNLQLCAFIFAHELSHFNDHKLGYSLKYKETKADKFAYKLCSELNILM